MVSPTLIWKQFDPAASALPKVARKRLSRALRRDIAAKNELGLVAAALGIEAPPAAALARLADGLEAGERNWLLAEPVVLFPDRDALALLPLAAAPLEPAEEKALTEATKAHFGDELALERGASGRWYVAIEGVSRASGAPLEETMGRALEIESLASGPDAVPLRAFFTELQMLWHEHPVNAARRSDGRPEASALWLWGGGRLPGKPRISEPARIRADAPELVGLARWLGLECEALDKPAAGEPQADTLVAVGEAGETLGEAWLERFTVSRGGFRVYSAGSEWQVPPRRGLLPWPG